MANRKQSHGTSYKRIVLIDNYKKKNYFHHYREDDQIIGAYLNIRHVQTHNYGRYLCRIEIGNSAHRLDMFAWIFGLPTVVESDSVLPPLGLALVAAFATVGLLLIGRYFWCLSRQKRELNKCRALDTESAPALRVHAKA